MWTSSWDKTITNFVFIGDASTSVGVGAQADFLQSEVVNIFCHPPDDDIQEISDDNRISLRLPSLWRFHGAWCS